VKRIPSIKTAMTPFPYSIDARADLAAAQGMMDEHAIQHLPVVEDGQLVGLLWDRDIRVARSLGADLPAQGVAVVRVCNTNPLVVDADERLDRVVARMAEMKVGAAVVMRGDKLAGILTLTDVCRLLGELLHAHYGVDADDGGDAA